MNVALVILHADPARGGAERYTIDLAAALARRGHGVALIASDFAGVPDGVTSVPLETPGMTRSRQYKQFLDALDRHLDAAHYDVVHAMLPVRRCDFYHPHAGVAAAALERWNAAINPRRRVMAAVERELLTGAGRPVVLCLSDYVKRLIRPYYNLPPERLATLFNAVDLERFQPARRERGTGAAGASGLMIANDYERKGLSQTLAALAKLRDTALRLDVVGKEDPHRYQKMATELGVTDRVTFHGSTPDPRPRYAAADFFVLPTRHDPCSLVVLEALASGLPVISTVYNGACEIMTDGVHGFVLNDPKDVDALAGAMRQMADPARRREMCQACVALRPRLTYERHLDRLLEIYLAGARGAP